MDLKQLEGVKRKETRNRRQWVQLERNYDIRIKMLEVALEELK